MARRVTLIGVALLLILSITACGMVSTKTPSFRPTQRPTPAQASVPTQTPTDQPLKILAVVSISPNEPGYQIPDDFLGLSYEASVLSKDDFDISKTTFIHLLTALGKGSLRFGGSSVEKTYWDNYKPTTPNPEAQTLVPADLDRLFAFTKQVKWGIILGVNLGDYLPAMAAEEAAYALNNGGGQVAAIEIGNEPAGFLANGLRPKTWGEKDFQREFNAYVTAIHAAAPGALIAGPATVFSTDWFTQFLDSDSSAITLATHHIYPLSADPIFPSTSPLYASIPQLLSAETSLRISDEVETLAKTASANHVPLRISETNSVSHGGKDGVSNVFASALWGTDYLFMLAKYGVAGVNFHGGFGCAGYSAICLRADQTYHAQPLYYGMLFFHLASENGQLVPTTIQTSVNVTAYAVVGADKSLRVVLINITADQDVTVQVNTGEKYGSASILRLMAPSLDAQDGITFGGSAVAADGTWTPTVSSTISPSNNSYSVALPAASAVLMLIP